MKYNHTAIITDYNNKMKYMDIQEKHGCSKSTIIRILSINNIKLRNKSTKKASSITKTETIIEQYKKGLKLNAIAYNHRVSRTYVNEILKRNNVNRNRKSSSNNIIIED